MATLTRNILVRNPGRTVVMPEAASQTFKIGDFLLRDANGRAAIAASADSAVGTGAIIGRARSNASGTTGADVLVELPNENTEYCLPVFHSTAGSAVTAIGQKLANYGIARRDVSGTIIWVYHLEETTNTHFVVREFDGQYPVGEQYGTAWGAIERADRIGGE